MSETAKVRSFRCHRCRRLYSELKDYSAYICASCHAVLIDKRKTHELEGEMFGLGVISARSSEKSDADETTNKVSRFYKNVNFNNRYDNNGNGPISGAQVFVDSLFPNGNAVGLQRPSTSSYYLEEEKNSNFSVHSNYRYGDSNPVEKRFQNDQFHGNGYQVDERAELLRKLDELRDQLTGTCHVTDKFLLDNRIVSHSHDHYTYSSCHLCDRDHSSSSNQFRRGLHQPYGPPFEHKPFSGVYKERNHVHIDSFESYGPIMYRDDEVAYDHRSIHEVQESHHSTANASSYHSESRSGQTVNNKHICQPIIGGAPFLTCQNCYELIILPKKVFVLNENDKKVKCGSCSTTIMILVDSTKRLDFSLLEGPNKLSTTARMSFFYKDIENSSSMSTKSCEGKSVHSTYSSSSDKVEDVQTLPATEKEPIVTEMAVKNSSITPPPTGSRLQDYFDYSDKFRVMQHINKGEGMQDSMKNGYAIEIDVPSSVFSNTGNSTNCDEESKNGDDKVPQLLENCLEDKVDIVINGNNVPYLLIKRAEKLAGPIFPGHYWYDFRAGFWGVMDGPCLGIIPPYIEEFNWPMVKSCTGGKTGVFVNGRELHEKDLKLLSRRGLPTERDRCYIVEISGRVLDEVTGEELDQLGKLAPTVERSNHGFGMRDPKATSY